MKVAYGRRRRASQRGVVAAEFLMIFPILFIGIMYGLDLYVAMQFTWMMQDRASGMARQLALGQSLGATDNIAALAAIADQDCTPALVQDTTASPQLIQLTLTCKYPGIMFQDKQIAVTATWPAIEHIVTPPEFAAAMTAEEDPAGASRRPN